MNIIWCELVFLIFFSPISTLEGAPSIKRDWVKKKNCSKSIQAVRKSVSSVLNKEILVQRAPFLLQIVYAKMYYISKKE